SDDGRWLAPGTLDLRVGPAAADGVIVGENLLDRVLQHFLREQRARAHRGADDWIGEQQNRRTDGHAGRERRLHAHLELLRLLRDIGLAADGDTGRGTDDAQIVAFHDAILDADVAGDFVEGETFAEQIAEVERQAAL